VGKAQKALNSTPSIVKKKKERKKEKRKTQVFDKNIKYKYNFVNIYIEKYGNINIKCFLWEFSLGGKKIEEL
jgi:hypothetical protein